jgi:GNAT superfamily N-acetyltransferase
MGWVVQRHGEYYFEEHGWDERHEALAARLVSDFIFDFDPARDCCWIAERDGMRVGSVFVIRHGEREGVARLRMLFVEPDARGLGIGRRLVEACTAFARGAGYHTLTLWTIKGLDPARRLYEREGYRLVVEEPYDDLGSELDLTAQTWEMTL